MYLIKLSRDNTLKLWDAETGAEIRTLTGHSDGVKACAFSSDGTRVLFASLDNMLKLWDAETGAELMIFPTLGKAYTITIGANNLIATGDAIGWIYFLRPHSIEFGPAIITPVRLYNFNTKSYDKEFSINCQGCGVRIPLNDELVWQKSEDHPEGRLGEVMECPSCRKSLKLTSFVVGKKE